ncbi:Protein of unknown function DUF262 [Candidatus Methanoperedens nitroreducens]|uniref:GmrSD restriction endonucleases N-terminal domain-containing protein n=1 Tax=Candidatus Methanoperedens nitratireducens TaxID=1392998 RepID=A0A062V9D3_9EURY|nr:DUF262 domain-containing protein [Candidatus Methanoperedens nitroreducens]KCZ71930.1 Protein of unknown function DUF262 [Candidatus Methanoperedens nitroreducens]MDJ1422095.1 DUF262 domain-containing protein [Candidatus Methanoperedens sp.]
MLLQDEIDEKAKEIYTDGYPMSIGELISLYKDNELDIHPEFQRFFRWTPLQKTKLIESILLGIPIPPIFVSQREDGVWDVVDGLQRLSTIFEFVGILKDENNNIFPPSRLIKTKYLPSLEGKMWESSDAENSLTSSQRLEFKREKIGVQIVKKESDPNIKYELFQRLNTLGTKLSDQELRNCLLIMINKDFYYWLYDLGAYEPFLNCIGLSEKSISEQYNLELALRFIIFKNVDIRDMKGFIFLAEFITEKMTEFAESSTFDKEKEKQIFKDTFDFLDKTLSDDAFKRYNFERNRFEGKFLLSSFEAIGIGVGSNIDEWNKRTIDENLKEEVKNRAKSLWSDRNYLDYIGSGSNFNTRIPVIVPLGKKIFKP